MTRGGQPPPGTAVPDGDVRCRHRGKLLLSGHAAEYAYEQGRLDRSLPFEELKRRSRINTAARAADRAPDFSRRIRDGLPGLDRAVTRGP